MCSGWCRRWSTSAWPSARRDGLAHLGTPDFARTLRRYLLFALIALLLNRRSMGYVNMAVSAALIVDIVAAVLAIAAMHDARIGIAMMLAVNLSAGALILPLRLSSSSPRWPRWASSAHSFFDLPRGGPGDRDLLEAACSGWLISPVPRCATCWAGSCAPPRRWPSSAAPTWPTCRRSTS
jgi:hypothetical protein